MKKRLFASLVCSILLFTACDGLTGGDNEAASVPTSTLAPLISLTPRFTATPVASRTPRPTFTPIPSETPIPPSPTNTATPTEKPPIIGIVQSLQAINMREGPAVSFGIVESLTPGTGVTVLSQNPDGTWYNVKIDDGREGWVAAYLLFIENTPTPLPTLTPSPDLTALALGTPLPTAVIGGGTVTPTPPLAAVTATPLGTEAATASNETVEPTATESFLPIVDVNSINLTATALAGGSGAISPPPPLPTTGASSDDPTQATQASTTSTPRPTLSGDGVVRQGADVFAMCNDPAFGVPAPTDLAAGSTVEIFWAWYMSAPSYINQHLSAVEYEVRLNGELLEDWDAYGQPVVQVEDRYAKYWYVPVGELEAGEYRITYRATWSRAITDGFNFYGPETAHPIEEGSCDFVVR